jgi:hypothetical protein
MVYLGASFTLQAIAGLSLGCLLASIACICWTISLTLAAHLALGAFAFLPALGIVVVLLALGAFAFLPALAALHLLRGLADGIARLCGFPGFFHHPLISLPPWNRMPYSLIFTQQYRELVKRTSCSDPSISMTRNASPNTSAEGSSASVHPLDGQLASGLVLGFAIGGLTVGILSLVSSILRISDSVGIVPALLSLFLSVIGLGIGLASRSKMTGLAIASIVVAVLSIGISGFQVYQNRESRRKLDQLLNSKEPPRVNLQRPFQ